MSAEGGANCSGTQKGAEDGANAQGIRSILLGVRAADELERASATMKQDRTRGLLIIGDPRLGANRKRVITLNTAKALGLTIPPSLLLRADELIQ